jgi:hypothetical protein
MQKSHELQDPKIYENVSASFAKFNSKTLRKLKTGNVFRINPLLFIRRFTCLHSVQTSLTQNCELYLDFLTTFFLFLVVTFVFLTLIRMTKDEKGLAFFKGLLL